MNSALYKEVIIETANHTTFVIIRRDRDEEEGNIGIEEVIRNDVVEGKLNIFLFPLFLSTGAEKRETRRA